MRKNVFYIHGYAKRGQKHPLYKVWTWMKSRCYNLNDTSYHNYGKRNISICDEWINNPVAFIEWALENGWKKDLVIDREDNNGNYSPENCRFVNLSISCSNQRIRKDNTSGFRGVNFRKGYNRWVGRIQFNKKRIELCWEKTAEEAAKKRDKYIIENNLPHLLNFPIEEKI